ncbi:MAG: hypothetical protein ACJAWV_000473 [Flammeovirgaceae bacterium]|jgi:hypothetical protein
MILHQKSAFFDAFALMMLNEAGILAERFDSLKWKYPFPPNKNVANIRISLLQELGDKIRSQVYEDIS